MALTLSTTRDADTITVSVAGDVDLSTVADLDHAVLAAVDDATGVVVDLAAVTFIDSAGINTLLKSRRLADERGRHFRIANATGVVHDVLDLTGVLGHLSG
ncbi:STAS domain-containing protein [Dactylosporangium sp. NBC_01737]|uniref:STAS domain-containing protein n=1 Tax=Dactylosporangium sp. NBC_01737 TaxID=2975959 RepID=UPI002E1121FF|nr:STAS domain-containing protein [Dactylosporangium sp. NBC_01737]